MRERPFRFGLQAFEGASANEWFDTVRRAEQAGYSTLFSSDHYFGPGAIADATGHRPVAIGPAHVDRDGGCADIDLARRLPSLRLRPPSPGRARQGDGDPRRAVGRAARGRARRRMGARGVRRARCPMRRPGVRIAKLGEYVELMRAHWSGEQIDVHGEHVDVSGFAGLPRPVQQAGPPIMIGGGAPRILGLAGRLADIVSLNFDNSSGTARQCQRVELGRRRDGEQDPVDPGRCRRAVRCPRARDRRLLRGRRRRCGGAARGDRVEVRCQP